jgi:phosphatidylserine/phosphatidylglycerophosphate/cardiolipin synthase-like enzyme
MWRNMRRVGLTIGLVCAAPAVLAAPPVLPARGTVQAAFTPRDDIEGLIVGQIDAARAQVLVQAYLLSNKAITRALVAARERGVEVKVLADRDQTMREGFSRIPELARAGIPVWLEVRYKSAHNKTIVTDPQGAHPTVTTGSFNFTQTAQRGNAENVLIVRDHPELARAYAENWQRHADDALPYRAVAGAADTQRAQ